MRRDPRPDARAARRRAWAAALIACAAAGCASVGGGGKSATADPAALHRELLEHNRGLRGMRASVEARLSYAGRELTFPGVLLAQWPSFFRLELLDPLDRPAVMFWAGDGKITQYRPAARTASSLAPFTAECRAIDPGEWVGALLGSSTGPVAGDELSSGGLLGGRSLDRRRGGTLRLRVHYDVTEAGAVPRMFTWYCDGVPAVRLVAEEWQWGGEWRIPLRVRVDYLQAGLGVDLRLRDFESNPPTGDAVRPSLGTDTRWLFWDLSR